MNIELFRIPYPPKPVAGQKQQSAANALSGQQNHDRNGAKFNRYDTDEQSYSKRQTRSSKRSQQ